MRNIGVNFLLNLFDPGLFFDWENFNYYFYLTSIYESDKWLISSLFDFSRLSIISFISFRVFNFVEYRFLKYIINIL